MKNIQLAILVLLHSMPCILFAQTTDTTEPLTLQEVITSVNKQEEIKKNVAQDIKVLSLVAIQNSHANTTADVLLNAGIPVQKSQLGGGSPILRGFEASRIVLMIDGVRLNNLIYRAGHLQDVIKTDNSSLDKVEILFGPSSTMYGSDALGGVINLYTKGPVLSNNNQLNFKGNILSRYESAFQGFTNHVDVNFGGNQFASLTSFTYSQFGDLMSGTNTNPFYDQEYGTRSYYTQYLGGGKDTLIKNNNRFLQIGNAYSQYDLIQKLLFQQNKFLSHSLNLQYSNSSNVPRYDRLTDPSTTGLKYAEWYYGPQTRLLAAYDLHFKKIESGFDNIHLGVNYQMIDESRHNRNFNSPSLSHRIEKVHVIGASLDVVKKIKEDHDIRFGLDLQFNTLQSTANKENIVTHTSTKLDTRYPDGTNSMNNFAFYFSHTWKINPRFTLVDGFRLGYTSLYSTLVDTALLFHLPYTTIKQNTPTYSGNIGIISTPTEYLKFSFLVSTGFRVSNIDDLSKIFESAKGQVIVPNPTLQAEKTINYELGITTIFNRTMHWENSIYYTDYRDIPTINSFQLNGQDSLLYDGTMCKIFANQNQDRAYIFGFSSHLVSHFGKHFNWSASMNYIYGRSKTGTSESPLSHIPPFTACTSLSYTARPFNAEFFVLYNGWKKLADYALNTEDNEQYATEKGMPAWFTINLRFSYQLYRWFTLQAGIDNLLDVQYRTFASGINGAGRNFIVALRGTF